MLRMLRPILDLVLPRECAGCGAGHESASIYCTACDGEMEQLDLAARCRFCAMPLTLVDSPCAHCMGNGLPPFDRIVGLGVLRDCLKATVHQIKFRKRWPLAEGLADRLMQREDVRAVFEVGEVLLPVPLHRKRQMERGFNQAEVMARRIAKMANQSARESKVTMVRAGNRIRNTKPQSGIHGRAPRVENLQGAFVLTEPAKIAGKHVVLVDDVITTGATLVSFARTIKHAGPASISAIVLAVADPKGRAFEVI